MSLRWAAALGYAVVMALFSLGTNRWVLQKLGFVVELGQKGLSRNGVFTLLHLLGFGLLGVLLVNALSQGFTAQVDRRRTLQVGVAAALYAAALEGFQALQPSRTVDPLDLVANLLGLALGLGITLALARRAKLAAPESESVIKP